MKKSLFAMALIGLVTCVPAFAEAGSSRSSSSSSAKAEMPARPKFVEYQGSGTRRTMRIEGLGKRGDDDGYAQYDVYDDGNAKVIANLSVEGIIGIKGVGEALKKHVLDVYSDSTFESDLIRTNRDRLLALWSKSSPRAPSSDAMRKEVPALSTKFGDNFDFEIRVFPSRDGGTIHLWVRPNGSGKVKVLNPEALDKMVSEDPAFRSRR